MIRYLLECMIFQLVFLLIYDLFLKRETFFQWNRVYLLGTFLFSLALPWIRVEALKTTVTEAFIGYPFLFQLDELVLYPTQRGHNFWTVFSWEYWCYGVGALLMACWFGIKLLKIYRLRKRSSVHHLKTYVKVMVPESRSAFSFFKNIFIGQEIMPDKQQHIIAHELVHVKQWHSMDLIFFEVMRVIFWFNPLIYIYQQRTAELHEFMADAILSKENKKGQYQSLLSEVFQTQNISFVNQFFKQSLIKKRIVMLTKQKSNSKLKLKYILLLPVIIGMLVYTSCEQETSPREVTANETSLVEKLTVLNQEIEKRDSLSLEERTEIAKMAETMVLTLNQSAKEVNGWKVKTGLNSTKVSQGGVQGKDVIPFGVIDQVPIFAGCENSQNTKACFMEKINEHIRKNFNYPAEAEAQGIQGRVNVMFRISEEGTIKDIKTRGPHKLLENEVVRIISKLPQLQPGKHQGRIVEVPFSIPISFKLD